MVPDDDENGDFDGVPELPVRARHVELIPINARESCLEHVGDFVDR